MVTPPGTGFLFGGLSMAAILRCAAETVGPGLTPMSLHATFLNNGDWGGPHELEVERVNDGRTFALRRINMVTGGRLAIVAQAVFHQPEAGDDWQAMGPSGIPEPETLEPLHPDRLTQRVIDIRPVSPASGEAERLHPYWCRTLERLHDPTLLACALAFASDYWVYATPFPVGSGRSRGLLSRTFSHTLVFHRQLPGDSWWLFDCDPLSVFGGRFLSRGVVMSRDGALLASFVQEGVIRPAR